MRLFKLNAGLVFSLLLSGCHAETMDRNYLMRHPDVLQTQYAACEKTESLSFCPEVKAAARDFMVLVDERSHDPEQFGHKIMDLEINLAQLKEQHAPADKIQDADQQLSLLYAVVAATSEE